MTLATRRTLATFVFAAAATLTVGGCGYRGDVTPELDSYAASHQQDANTYARVVDSNTRSIWDDLQRILLIDRPSRLNPYPVP